MFSRRDIEKELGKGISVCPFNPNNIKENSINFSVGDYAWSLKEGVVVQSNDKYKMATSNDKNNYKITKGGSAIIKKGNNKKLILLPHTTTIVETKEVIGLANYLGGTIHSKVGIVAHGVGHISTMMGPCFCGHLMIAVHNVTDEVISISVGDTFISLVFHYLDTPSRINKNSNISGHVDKLAELGININSKQREFLTKEWKQDFDGITVHMSNSQIYKGYMLQLKKNQFKEIRKYINFHNVVKLTLIIILLLFFYHVTKTFDVKHKTTVWSDRYWNVVITAILIPFFNYVFKFSKKDKFL